MTRDEHFYDLRPLNEAIERAVATYGALPVLARVLRATLRQTQAPPDPNTATVPDYLRRDVGLDPEIRRTPDRIFTL